jgi:hypothetical protein
MTDRFPDRDTDPALAALLQSAYAERVDMELAARHLWMIHRAADALRSRRVVGTRKALVAMLAGSMLFMSSGGALAASSNALPGDVLYGVKRGVEQARIVLTVSRQGDARLHLALAKRRMAEASASAVERPEVVPDLVRDALDSLEVAERTGGQSVAVELEEVRRETSEQLDVLVAVLDSSVDTVAGPNRKAATPEARMTLAELVPSASPSTEASPTGAAESPGATPTASAETSPTPERTTSGSPSPSESQSPTGSPSATPSEETTEEPSGEPTPTESAPTSTESSSPAATESASTGPTRRYEEWQATPSAAPEPAPEPAPSPAPAP